MPQLLQEKGDRAYIASSDVGMKTVTITKKAIDGLIKWNAEGFVSDPQYDRRFVKTLLIACIGQRNIAEGNYNATVTGFMKGL